MISEVQALLDRHRAWLKDKTVLREVNDWVEITTPYLDRHNDYLQIYAQRNNGQYTLTDDGYVLQDLQLSGCKLDSGKRQALLKMTLNGFGVHLEEGRLEVKASPDNFALRKHNLVQAMLAVNDLFYVASPVVSSLFYEDVLAWLELHEIRYTPRVKFTGKSGIDHLFDFVIPKSRVRPERILRTVNRPNKTTAEILVFSWIDTKEVRPPASQAYAILNDAEQPPPTMVVDVFRSYDVHPVLWSKREDVRQELSV
ncbi:MAG TPA: DUF1828 domain-containing protein [Terriglobia bacterium]|nr:DUF1828 domain-containing protein [Terriglobia bacterium]